MILPIVIGSVLVLGVAKAVKDRRGVLTPEREKTFKAAMESIAEPEKLRTLADAYEKVGLPEYADMLRKRASLRTLPKEVKDEYKQAVQTALSSTDKDAVANFVAALEQRGMTGNAAKVREYLAGLE